jgi:hypothetical protein
MALAKKPQGGYRLLPVSHLCIAWCAYKSHRLSWLGFRVFLALQEIAARRDAARRTGHKGVDGLWLSTVVPETRSLVGCARASQVRSTLKSLERVGLIRREQGQIRWTVDLKTAGESSVMAKKAGRCGTVPVPRRVLRYLSSEGSSAVAAYMLGVVLRCCHIRSGGEFRSRGRCSARFVAELFGLHLRTIKHASAMVARLGWVEKEPPDRWVRRHGPVVHVNIQWAGVSIKSPPQTRPVRTKSPPANKKQELLSDPRNQEPPVVPKAAPPRPQVDRTMALRSMSMAELGDPDRLTSRFRLGAQAGLVDDSVASRLRFFAAAQHALRVGTRNPCGLFATLVRRRLWRFISQEDEDRARNSLRKLDSLAASRQSSRVPNKQLRELVAGVADKLGRLSLQDATNSRTTEATWSKKLARSSSPQTASSSRIASIESVTDSAFSTSVVRNTACSSTGCVYRFQVSMPRACHEKPRPRNLQKHEFAPHACVSAHAALGDGQTQKKPRATAAGISTPLTEPLCLSKRIPRITCGSGPCRPSLAQGRAKRAGGGR